MRHGLFALPALAALLSGCVTQNPAYETPADSGSDLGTSDGRARLADRGRVDGRADRGTLCAFPLVLCNGRCVNGQQDPLHCGKCDRVCPKDTLCERGSCTPQPPDCTRPGSTCPAGYYCDAGSRLCRPGCSTDTDCGDPAINRCNGVTQVCQCSDDAHRCGLSCVRNQSVGHCGAACAPCPTDPNGTALCDGAKCSLQCKLGFHGCAGKCVPDDSPATCGKSCAPCPVPQNAVSYCKNAQCGFACVAGFHRCGSGCRADDDATACGAGCTMCPAPRGPGQAVCMQNTCAMGCNPGFHLCGTACVANDSPATCGAHCTPCDGPEHGTATCDGAACGITCAASYVPCNGKCERTDANVQTAWAAGQDSYVATDLALDPVTGTPHILHLIDSPTYRDRYSIRSLDGKAWVSDTFAQNDEETSTRLLSDSKGQLNRVLFYVTSAGLQSSLYVGHSYRERTSGVWFPTSLYNSLYVTGGAQALALDGNDTAHVLFHTTTTLGLYPKLFYRKVGGPLISVTNGVTDNYDLAVDRQGVPRVAYGTAQLVTFGYLNGSTFAWTPVGNGGSAVQLRLDAQDRPHLVYISSSGSSALTYATYDTATWKTELLPVPVTTQTRFALALDPQGRPVVVAFDLNGVAMRVARRDAGRWSVVTPVTSGGLGYGLGMKINQRGVHVAYDQKGSLMYARITLPSCSP